MKFQSIKELFFLIFKVFPLHYYEQKCFLVKIIGTAWLETMPILNGFVNSQYRHTYKAIRNGNYG